MKIRVAKERHSIRHQGSRLWINNEHSHHDHNHHEHMLRWDQQQHFGPRNSQEHSCNNREDYGNGQDE